MIIILQSFADVFIATFFSVKKIENHSWASCSSFSETLCQQALQHLV
jgi:hypothetical protein